MFPHLCWIQFVHGVTLCTESVRGRDVSLLTVYASLVIDVANGVAAFWTLWILRPFSHLQPSSFRLHGMPFPLP